MFYLEMYNIYLSYLQSGQWLICVIQIVNTFNIFGTHFTFCEYAVRLNGLFLPLLYLVSHPSFKWANYNGDIVFVVHLHHITSHCRWTVCFNLLLVGLNNMFVYDYSTNTFNFYCLPKPVIDDVTLLVFIDICDVIECFKEMSTINKIKNEDLK